MFISVGLLCFVTLAGINEFRDQKKLILFLGNPRQVLPSYWSVDSYSQVSERNHGVSDSDIAQDNLISKRQNKSADLQTFKH